MAALAALLPALPSSSRPYASPGANVATEAGKDTAHSLTIHDYSQIGRLSGPRIGPDGRWVAYTVTYINREKEESRTRIWIAPTGGKTQVWTLFREGGEAVHRTMSGIWTAGGRTSTSREDLYERYLSWYGRQVKGDGKTTAARAGG